MEYTGTDGKEEAGRKLVLVDEAILAESSKLNRATLIPTLLCLEDAMDDFSWPIMKQFRIEKKFSEELYLKIRIVIDLYDKINSSLNIIANRGFTGPIKSFRLPSLRVGLCCNEVMDEYVKRLIDNGEIDEKRDTMVYRSLIVMDSIPCDLMFVLRKASKKHLDIFNKAIDLVTLFYHKSYLKHILSDNETKEQHNASQEPEKSYMRVVRSIPYVPSWNSAIEDVSLETLRSSGIRGKDNLTHIKAEHEELFKSYYQMKEYSEIFKKSVGISYETFFYAVSDMIYDSYGNPHTIGMWKRHDLLTKVIKNKGNDPRELGKLVELLLGSEVLNHRHCNIFSLGDRVVTNYNRLEKIHWVLPQYVFDEKYTPTLKGSNFEEACRKSLRDKGFTVFPRRVSIHDPMLFSYMDSPKRKSDIDVLGGWRNHVIVVECKEIKTAEVERGQKRRRDLIEAAREDYCKTKWLADNIDKFEEQMGGDLGSTLSVNKKSIIHFLPITVTNKPFELETEEGIGISPIISFRELNEISFSKDLCITNPEDSSGSIKVRVFDYEFNIPWFSAKPTTRSDNASH